MDSKELLEHYEVSLMSAGFSSELSRYLSTLAKQALVSLDTLNKFSVVNFVVTLENM